MKKIAVLLAAYNCEKYLHEQIETILNQVNVEVTIFVSLDKSSDDSYEILQTCTKRYKNINLLEYGKRYGSAGQNFFRLICEVNTDMFDYICFSDQDDIWFPSKLSHGIKVLKDSKADAYSADVFAYWNDKNSKLLKKSYPQVEFDYLFESAGPGCTYIFKKDKYLIFQDYLRKNNNKLETVWLHDWLSYSFYRNNNFKWVIDDMPHMYYRQHSRNEVGANLNIKSMLSRVKILLSDNGYDFVIKQAEFLNQNNLKPIMLINFKTRSAFFKLSMMSYKFRRKKIEKFLCMLFFMYKSFKGR